MRSLVLVVAFLAVAITAVVAAPSVQQPHGHGLTLQSSTHVKAISERLIASIDTVSVTELKDLAVRTFTALKHKEGSEIPSHVSLPRIKSVKDDGSLVDFLLYILYILLEPLLAPIQDFISELIWSLISSLMCAAYPELC